MTNERLAVKLVDRALVFDPRAPSPMVRRGLARLDSRLRAAESPPATLRLLPENVPREFMALPQWVCWRWRLRGEKWRKPPIDPTTGRDANENNPSTWTSFSEAVNAHVMKGLPGVGFVFTPPDPFLGIDLDRCRDPATGELDPWADQIVAALDSYSELSPTGRGVHVVVRAALPFVASRRKGLIELYNAGQFFVMTGHRLLDTPQTAQPRQAEIDALYDRLFCGNIDEAEEPWFVDDSEASLETFQTERNDPWAGMPLPQLEWDPYEYDLWVDAPMPD